MTRALRPLLLAALPLLIGAAPDTDTSWYAISAGDGQVIGYSSSERVRDGGVLTVTDYRETSFRELDQPAVKVTDRTVTRYGANGRPVEISERIVSDRDWSELHTAFTADEAIVTRTTRVDTRTTRIKLPPEARADAPATRCMPGDGYATTALNPAAMAVERTVYEVAKPSASPTTIIRRTYEGDELRGIAKLTYDGDCKLTAVTQPMFGTTMTIRPVSREVALQPHDAYRVLANVMVKSPFRIPDGARNGHIRFAFGFRDGLTFAIPETGEQRVVAGTDGATVDICDTCGPGLSSDPAYLADALRPTPWLQSDAEPIRALARPIARMKMSDARKMRSLAVVAKLQMRNIDFVGHYSALETLKRGSGDCTEAAVLLAALGRAAGIPTRVVNGMVYSRVRYHGVSNAFMPHSWTLAWADGRWQSFDMALDTFDSTHVALSIGNGDARSVSTAMQLASLLVWRTMAEVRPQPGG